MSKTFCTEFDKTHIEVKGIRFLVLYDIMFRTTLEFTSYFTDIYCHDKLLHARLAHASACQVASCDEQSACLYYHIDHNQLDGNRTSITDLDVIYCTVAIQNKTRTS